MPSQRRRVASVAVCIALGGCSSPSSSTLCEGTYHGGTSVGAVALNYPQPQTTGVPTTAGVLILSSSTVTPVQLLDVSATTAQAAIRLAPVALPSPLPAAVSTPIPGSGSTYFAVALPSLAPATTYRVLAQPTVANVGCVTDETPGTLEDAGQFTTQ